MSISHNFALTIATLAFTASNAPLAKSPAYCISAIDSPSNEKTPSGSSKKPALQLELWLHGKRYLISADQSDRIELRSAAGLLLQQVEARQSYGRINDLAVREDGWLWIDGDDRDYQAWVERTADGPRISTPNQISGLKEDQCSRLEEFVSGCRKARAYYSRTLQKVFVTGYPSSIFGFAAISSEQIDGHTRTKFSGSLLPAAAGELPQFNGVLFRNIEGALHFHNGHSVVPLPLPPLKTGGWTVGRVSDGERVFFYDNASGSTFELVAGPTLKRIQGYAATNSWHSFFSLPGRTEVFDVSLHGISVIAGGRSTLLAAPPDGYQVWGPAGIRRSEDAKALLFPIRNRISGEMMYFELRVDSKLKCDVLIDAPTIALIPLGAKK